MYGDLGMRSIDATEASEESTERAGEIGDFLGEKAFLLGVLTFFA